MTVKNTGHLCSVYCPSRLKDTDKISFNLLRKQEKQRSIALNAKR